MKHKFGMQLFICFIMLPMLSTNIILDKVAV